MNIDDLKKLYLSREGRIGRMTFWLGLVGLAVIIILVSVLVMPLVGLGMMADNSALVAAANDPAEMTRIMSAAVGRSSWASLILFAVFVLPASALLIKRRHDRNSAGKVVWIYFGLSLVALLLQVTGLGYSMVDMGGFQVPLPNLWTMLTTMVLGIIGIYLLVVCGFLKGDDGDNSYGPPPSDNA
jgi:uncharacterized membrane protein YhaH (DUF805 family)